MRRWLHYKHVTFTNQRMADGTVHGFKSKNIGWIRCDFNDCWRLETDMCRERAFECWWSNDELVPTDTLIFELEYFELNFSHKYECYTQIRVWFGKVHVFEVSDKCNVLFVQETKQQQMRSIVVWMFGSKQIYSMVL